jgi:hypothetical protein
VQQQKEKWKARAENKRVQRRVKKTDSPPPPDNSSYVPRPGDRMIQDKELHRMISQHERSRPSPLNQGGE